jgi:chromosome segregation ATPase
MAENQPPANVYAPHDSAMQDCSLALSNLRGSNGSGNGRARGLPPVQRLYDLECGLRATAEKKLAVAQKKIEHVIEIRDRAREALAKSQAEVKNLKDTNKSDKAENKRKLDEQKAGSKAELANHKSIANIALLEKKNALREMTSEKVALQKKLDKGDKAFVTLEKQQETLQSKLHQVNSSETSLLSARTALQKEIKTLKRHVNRLEKVDNEQLEKKQAHELGIQKMKNEWKQLELEAAHTKLECKTKAPISKTSGASLSLEGRMELETHKVECKRRSKDDDLARDKMKRDMKSQTLQSNFGFTTNMMQSQTNATGGMWKQGSQGVQDVSG